MKFTPEWPRWVTKEVWRSQQETHTEPDGRLLLTFPYSHDRELVREIMCFGADVDVVVPTGLRSKVQKQFLAAA